MNHYPAVAKQTKYSFWGIVTAIATFLTVMSQLPALVEMGRSSLISRLVWLTFFGLILLLKFHDLKLRKITYALVTVGLYVLFVLVANVISPRGGYDTSLFSCVLLSFFVLVVGMLVGKTLTEQDLYLCGKVYVLTSLILAANLYFGYYRGYDIDNVVYAYGSKNSAGVILFTAALIAFVYGWQRGNLLGNLLNGVAVACLLYMVLVMKVRAVIVCIPLVALCAAIRAPFRKKVRIPLILLCVAVLVALQFDSVYDLLINNILFANRGEDLAGASSGRMTQWLKFFDNLRGQELFGDGRTEQESLILTAFLQCGIPVGGMIIAYGVWPLMWSLRRTNRSADRHMFLLLMVALSYFVNAIFEQLAPFGPGARCFYLWLLLGVLLAKEGRQGPAEGNEVLS